VTVLVTPSHFAQRAEFYHQLAQLTAAGIGIVPALEQIRHHAPSAAFDQPLRRGLEELAQGRSLTDALRAGAWLPEFDLTLLEAGERSGRLDSCFRVLAEYYQERAALAKQLVVQLLYPAFLIHLAALVFLIVLPFAASQFHASLIRLCARAALLLSPLYLGLALAIYAGQSRHGEKWRAFLEQLLQPVPLLGAGRRALALSRLALALEALLSAGVNIVEAWNLAAAASGSPALRRAVAAWKTPLAQGRTPAELVRETRLFPPPFAHLYHSGEISGKLDETLRRLHTFYREDGTHQLQLLAQWLPRAVYFLVVLIVGWKIIQFWTAYFNQINNAMHF